MPAPRVPRIFPTRSLWIPSLRSTSPPTPWSRQIGLSLAIDDGVVHYVVRVQLVSGNDLLTGQKTSDYKLITDGWFNSTKTADEYAVRVYDEESERADKQEIVDITDNGELFIDRDVQNVPSVS